jgi:hypothetical protein
MAATILADLTTGSKRVTFELGPIDPTDPEVGERTAQTIDSFLDDTPECPISFALPSESHHLVLE